MRVIIAVGCLLFFSASIQAQTYITRNGFIGFYSKTPMEDIKAESKQLYAVVDLAKKNVAFSMLVKGFQFQKQLMQEHFNENYMESDKYPKASFAGSYTGDVNAAKDGTYPLRIKGQLTLHGVTRPLDVPATIEMQQGKLTGKCSFRIKPGDFNIKIPALVRDKIAQLIDVTVLAECNPK